MFEPRCPDGKVKAKDCGPWNDLECVDQQSGTQAYGEAPVPGEPVTSSLEAPTAPSLSSGISWWIIFLICIAVLLLMVIGLCFCKKYNLGEVGGSDGRCWHSLLFPHFLPLHLSNLWVFLAWL